MNGRADHEYYGFSADDDDNAWLVRLDSNEREMALLQGVKGIIFEVLYVLFDIDSANAQCAIFLQK